MKLEKRQQQQQKLRINGVSVWFDVMIELKALNQMLLFVCQTETGEKKTIQNLVMNLESQLIKEKNKTTHQLVLHHQNMLIISE